LQTILHPDYWVEIPEGEFIFGLTERNLHHLHGQLKEKIQYAQRPQGEKDLIDLALRKLVAGHLLSEREESVFGLERPGSIYYWKFAHVFPQKIVHLKRFYMARYLVTRRQYYAFRNGQAAFELPGALEEPETKLLKRTKKTIYTRCPAEVQIEPALQLCEQLGARLPSVYEWEKAARGTDGRLYPWGNMWMPNAGFFSYLNSYRPKVCDDGKAPVDAYPLGVSPYGVWGMAGSLPELVTVPPEVRTITFEYRGRRIRNKLFAWIEEFRGEPIYIDLKWTHPKDIDPLRAPLEHLIPQRGGFEWLWLGLRLILDEWPKQIWSGHDIQK
jgi:formylglycine-generating enzyme required for sulfatase activity